MPLRHHPMPVDHYFAYGSNMNPDRARTRGLGFTAISPARLRGMRLVFDKVSRAHPGVAHANIVYAPEDTVEGVLYRLRSPDEILGMDPFERVPVHYGRDVVYVASGGGHTPAWTYFANPAVRKDGLRPPCSYLGHLLAGRDYLTPRYFRWLERTPCADQTGPLPLA